MSDNNQRVMENNNLGEGETPIILPPSLCAQAQLSNRYSIVGCLVNPEKQSMSRLIKHMPCVWGLADAVIGRMLDSRRFQFVFPTEESLTRVLRNGPWSFADWMIVSRRWDSNVSTDDLKMVQFWVQIKCIPPHYLSRDIIEWIGNTLAEVVITDFDDYTNLTDHVWVLVNWNIDNPLRFKRKYQFANGEISMLTFCYHRLVNFYCLCGMLTHDDKVCPLHIREDSNTKKREENVVAASGLLMDDKSLVFTNALSGSRLNVGSSGGVHVSNPSIPPIDTDKLAETLRYLKAKQGKGKFAMGHRWNPTDIISPIGNCDGDEAYNSFTDGDHAIKKTEAAVTTATYHPMEKENRCCIENDNVKESVAIGSIGGAKRKREEKDMSNSNSVVYSGMKKDMFETGVVSKQNLCSFSSGEVDKARDGRISVTKGVINPEFICEESESVDSSS